MLPSASTIRRCGARPRTRRRPRCFAVLADPVLDASDPGSSRSPRGSIPSDGATPDKATLRSHTFALSRTPCARPDREFRAVALHARGGPMRHGPRRASRTLKALDFDASRTDGDRYRLARYRIVHFATHALVNDDHPELSGVVLSWWIDRVIRRTGFSVARYLQPPPRRRPRGAQSLSARRGKEHRRRRTGRIDARVHVSGAHARSSPPGKRRVHATAE